MPLNTALIRARGLTKRFGSFTAVDGVDFELNRGEAFGFLGPNGAGKSSTMRMIGCVSPPTAGELSIFGLDPVADGPAIRARLGVVPQEDSLDVELTVRENLLVYGRYFGLPRPVIRERSDRLLEFVQLADRAGDRVEPLSGGLKRRLTIARSLINEPEILILDEPTTGLDPQARHVVWDRLYRLKQQGTTPSLARITDPLATGSSPRMVSSPPLGGETQPIMRIVVLLPAPLGPRKPVTSPGRTAKDRPLTAIVPP